MTPRMDEILSAALELEPDERAILADRLLGSLDEATDTARDKLWAEEVESRLDAYDKGILKAVSAEVVFAEIERLKYAN